MVRLTDGARIGRDELIDKPVGARHRHQRALHSAAPPPLLARQLRPHAAAVPACRGDLPFDAQLPLYTAMSDADQDRVIAALHELLRS